MSRPGPGGEGAGEGRSAAMSVLELRGVSKTYGQEPAAVRALGGWLLAGREPPLITRQPIE